MAGQTDIEPNQVPPLWTEALERAEADLAAGRVHDGMGVRQRLRDSIRRMQADANNEAAKSS